MEWPISHKLLTKHHLAYPLAFSEVVVLLGEVHQSRLACILIPCNSRSLGGHGFFKTATTRLPLLGKLRLLQQGPLQRLILSNALLLEKKNNKSKYPPRGADMLRVECREGGNQHGLRIPSAVSNVPSTWA